MAGIVDELGVVEITNEYLGKDPREQSSAGVAVKAMILNGLGFASAPLYLFGQFFQGKATEHLLGMGVQPEHLNDDLESSESLAIAATMPIRICYGYSRDHRPDFKQFVMNLVGWGDGDMPAFIELADGNQSDEARFAGLLEQFEQQWDFDGVYVADGALYSAENLKQMGSMHWISRVPLTLSAASALIESIDESAFQPSYPGH